MAQRGISSGDLCRNSAFQLVICSGVMEGKEIPKPKAQAPKLSCGGGLWPNHPRAEIPEALATGPPFAVAGQEGAEFVEQVVAFDGVFVEPVEARAGFVA